MYRFASRLRRKMIRRRRDPRVGGAAAKASGRAKYRRRETIVEHCFAELKERQGLQRFRGAVCEPCAANSPCIASPSIFKKVMGPSAVSIIYIFIPVTSAFPSRTPCNPDRVAAAAEEPVPNLVYLQFRILRRVSWMGSWHWDLLPPLSSRPGTKAANLHTRVLRMN